MWEHKNHSFHGFTSKYCVDRLVYFETFKYVDNAIKREKEIKGWLRAKKIALIEADNPTWEDLSADWFDGKDVKRISFEPRSEDKGVSNYTAGPSLRSG